LGIVFYIKSTTVAELYMALMSSLRLYQKPFDKIGFQRVNISSML